MFKLARRKKFMTHVSLPEIASRKLPATNIPLTIDEQKSVEKAIKQNMFKYPEESLLVSLCFYHGLSTSDIKNIKVKDIDVDKKINFENRSPAYLLKDDLIMLEAYARTRREIKNIVNKPYLFVSKSSSEYIEKIQ
ncbi:hypothetical protein [Bacillus toyonensis]|uniref:hypothetical protein n=1 Tax=Bacillus toyonensis TaxID=155322 RepID=UPI00210064B8|nr:hypothetical protein [Bacillus toyonensis]